MNLDPAVKAACDRLAKPYLHRGSGAIIAIATPDTVAYHAYGSVDAVRAEPPSPSTLFEIGSITKVFTAILLARMALNGRIDLDAPIGEIRTEFAGAPRWITPRALATHTAGLPRVPFTVLQLLKLDTRDPYGAFTRPDLVSWIAGYRPRSAPRTLRAPRYSNLGVGLLGELLAMVSELSYEALIRREVLAPLGLTDTTISLSDDQRSRLATPHRGSKATSPWEFKALAGAGALRSTAGDLITFSNAVIEAPRGKGPLHAAISESLEVQVSPPSEKMPSQCLGWIRLPQCALSTRVYFHDGGTLGSASTLFVLPDAGVAVVALANQGLTLWRMIQIARSKPDTILNEIVATAGTRRQERI
jgi:CubicO group peptidase (beta-lactamase class C family)